jgi:cell shape-determining protein MreC
LRENEALQEEIARLSLRVAELEGLEDENEELRTIARVAENSSGVGAPVISSMHSSPYGTFLIGAGESNGIKAGALVIAGSKEGSGFVIGRASDVSARSSLVVQVFAPEQKTEAMIGKIPLSVEGQGGGNARAKVPRDAQIREGDTVVSARFRGLPIGIVGSIVEDTAGAYQTVYIGLPVNLTTLKFVYVLP